MERSPLIKHTLTKGNQEESKEAQNADRNTSNSDNQEFLADVSSNRGEYISKVRVNGEAINGLLFDVGGATSFSWRGSEMAQDQQVKKSNERRELS